MSSPTPTSSPRLNNESASLGRPRRKSAARGRRVVLRGLLRRAATRSVLVGLVVTVTTAVAAVIWVASRTAEQLVPVVPYSDLAIALADGGVSELTVADGGTRLVARFRTSRLAGERQVPMVSAIVPPRAVTLEDLERWGAAGAKVRVQEGHPGRSTESMLQLLSVLLMIGFLGWVVVRHRTGSLGKGRFVATPPDRQLTLADVGGAQEAQADLRDVIEFLRDPTRFQAMGARCPKGILLVGPPGTGKTLLARAVAGEAGCPVIMAAGSDFNEMYVGVGSRRVRALAKQARELAPCIVFIDEFDSLGGRRGRPNRSGEEEVTLNQLLVEMDGIAGNEGVIWMAATNREDMLDPAVRRPGRFDRVVEVPLPGVGDRLQILKIHAAKCPLSADVDLERLARLTVGHSGAELANLLNEATIIAVQERSAVVGSRHVEQARDRILLGRVRAGVVVTEAERRLIALHEAGHAIVGMVACPEDKLHKVTIEPRGRSLGAAHFAPESDRHLHPRRYLEGIIAKALGGRAAETVFLGPEAVTSGAGNDLVQATSIARRMVAEFGMSDEVGLISADPAAHGGAPSAQLQSQIDAAVRSLLTAQAERSERIVRQYREAVEALAAALVAHDVLPAGDVYGIAAEHGVPVDERLRSVQAA